jgi:predicted O-methyltransferase YrrM
MEKPLKREESIAINNFEGVSYRLADNWFNFIPKTDGPIQYLEIGTFYGANALSVEKTYAKHPGSIIYCVDPWQDYSECPQHAKYKNQQSTIYSTFMKNISNADTPSKFIVKRGFSNEVIPTFNDKQFDIIYIDGNHQPEYVLEDAVLCFRKLKPGGYMVFDDYGWGGPDMTKKGIDGFLNGYHKRIKMLGVKNTQVFIQRLAEEQCA